MSTTVSPAPSPVVASPASYPTRLIDRLTCTPITPENLFRLRSLNAQLFPVSYPEAYYTTTMRAELSPLCILIYLDGLAIAQVTCTLKPSERKTEAKLYWMLMGVLPPYREHGVARFACQKIMDRVLEHNDRIKRLQAVASVDSDKALLAQGNECDVITVLSKCPISSMFLHAHILNFGARRLYDRFGFREVKYIENVYRRKGPEDDSIKGAVIMEKTVADLED
ncbi:GNAT family acetyltransferase [Ceratobasidium sp. AG-Ba]|nr:GNAT family acetyltransferase [Ceratobasidium sp. AG-Ba]